MSELIPVFIGYDPREAIAYHTCVNSIIRHSSRPVSIVPLSLNLLGEFYSNSGRDGSNQFIYSRFLVPYLAGFRGHAIFIDGDMVLTSDIAELWDLRSHTCDVQVVKHDYQTCAAEKYLGAVNENYPRKNWSSVILWNCGAFPNRKLTPYFVQRATGAELHRFTWISDDRIGELPREWNWLSQEHGVNTDAKLIHYTLGTPSFAEFAQDSMAAAWHQERIYTEYCEQRGIR